MAQIFADPSTWLPIAFGALLGVSILIYVVLDGYDLGVGVLSARATGDDRDKMVASIGPFWDANETWLVLAVGILLVAFPAAHGAILTALYLPVALMLVGLILRGVSFELRAKAPEAQRPAWNQAFWIGSALTALTQGWMLGQYILGFPGTWTGAAFAALTAVLLLAGYVFLGACWLVFKTEGALQARAVRWAKRGLWGAAAGMAAISLATPLVSPRLWEKWFEGPQVFALSVLPALAALFWWGAWRSLARLPHPQDKGALAPFLYAAGLTTCGFLGMAYSFYPYVVPEKMTIFEAAAAPESLAIILVGAGIVVPIILAYSALSYWIFRGKAQGLRYH